jgi:hypothetical protein
LVAVLVGHFIVGKTKTSPDGAFEFSIQREKLPKDSKVSLRVLGKSSGPTLASTDPRGVTGDVLDFQIKLFRRTPKKSPGTYSGGLARILRSYRGLEGRLDPSNGGAAAGLKGLVRLIEGWKGDRRRLEKAGAAEVIQVPRHPRRTKHGHVTRWDEVMLPI